MKDEIIFGYKCFNKGLINRYGYQFEVGKTYHTDGIIKYGNHGNGYHIAKRLEDTLKFFTKDDEYGNIILNEDIDIVYVRCYGEYDEIPDNYEFDYAGDYDMYACEYMKIIKILTRDEILEYALSISSEQLKRFLMYFKLTEEEKVLFKEKYQNDNYILNYIAYYQDGNKEMFTKRRKK